MNEATRGPTRHPPRSTHVGRSSAGSGEKAGLRATLTILATPPDDSPGACRPSMRARVAVPVRAELRSGGAESANPSRVRREAPRREKRPRRGAGLEAEPLGVCGSYAVCRVDGPCGPMRERGAAHERRRRRSGSTGLDRLRCGALVRLTGPDASAPRSSDALRAAWAVGRTAQVLVGPPVDEREAARQPSSIERRRRP